MDLHTVWHYSPAPPSGRSIAPQVMVSSGRRIFPLLAAVVRIGRTDLPVVDQRSRTTACCCLEERRGGLAVLPTTLRRCLSSSLLAGHSEPPSRRNFIRRGVSNPIASRVLIHSGFFDGICYALRTLKPDLAASGTIVRPLMRRRPESHRPRLRLVGSAWGGSTRGRDHGSAV